MSLQLSVTARINNLWNNEVNGVVVYSAKNQIHEMIHDSNHNHANLPSGVDELSRPLDLTYQSSLGYPRPQSWPSSLVAVPSA